mmetsp:Transcript_10955/g.25948  ORF Transcript_10955/g.25948 Transcript_10955/m.25948 type:complete len:130 (+) Transcript_10955:182-571(+)
MMPMAEDNDTFPTFTFVVKGRPPLPGSDLSDLDRARTRLQGKISEQTGDNAFFPIPATIPVSLKFLFFHPSDMDRPSMMDCMDSTREICMGILYSDNTDILEKKLFIEKATSDGDYPDGAILIRVRPML